MSTDPSRDSAARPLPPRWWGIGRKLAPPRFVLFVLVFAGALAAAIPHLGKGRGVMAAFDIAAFTFLVSLVPLFRHDTPAQMRRASRANDANRALLLAVTGAVSLAILVAVDSELKGNESGAGERGEQVRTEDRDHAGECLTTIDHARAPGARRP